MDSQKKDPLYKSFGYAFEGIGTCIKKERNMKIHCAAAILVVIAGVILKISSLEWCICLTLFGLIMALELVNTAVEAVVDLQNLRSGDGRAEATCKDCKRYSSRCGSDRSNYGSDRRDYYFSAKGAYIPWVLKQIEIVKGDRRYGKFRRWS